MEIINTNIKDALIIKPGVFEDNRGFFMETYHQEKYKEAGINCTFVQDNLSYSKKGVLRGLHFQVNFPQAKLVQAIQGEIFDVAVDIRKNSPTFGQWTGVNLSQENKYQLFIPEGFAHGFCILSENAYVSYKCSDIYHADDEEGILWSDPDLNIEWPLTDPILSEKDLKNQTISKWTKNIAI